MAFTPDDIERREFSVAPLGYDRDEVDSFMVETAASFRFAMQNLLPGVTPWSTPPSSRPTEPVGAAQVAGEVAEILDASQRAAATMLSEAENDAARIRAGAERQAAQIREVADQDRERVKRLLLRSEEQAAAIIAQAEQQARQQALDAERETIRRTRDAIARSKRRATEVAQAERAAIAQLQALRAHIDAALDDEPQPADDDQGAPVQLPTSEHPDPTDAVQLTPVTDDPTTRLVRAAVSRAARSAAGATPTPHTAPDNREPVPSAALRSF